MNPGLSQHGINQRGFAVIYMSDNGDISKFHNGLFNY